jgi:hypothetical protein
MPIKIGRSITGLELISVSVAEYPTIIIIIYRFLIYAQILALYSAGRSTVAGLPTGESPRGVKRVPAITIAN